MFKRNFSLLVVASLAMLAGCDKSNTPTTAPNGQPLTNNGKPAGPPPVAPGTAITGTVNVRTQVPISADATMTIRLVEVAQADVSLAEKTVPVTPPQPFTFSLDFDRNKIDPKRTYEVNVTLTDGPRRFIPALISPVLTLGAGTQAEIALNAEPTPAELLKQEYKKLQAHIGGMRTIKNSFLTDTTSVGWDAFVDAGKVVYMRIITIDKDNNRSTVKYAFKDDKPMAVQMGNTLVAWNDRDEAIVNEKADGSTADEKQIKAIHDDAEHALSMAQEKLPKK
ncbi:MAG: YbaY family lipoprotein [Dokdonella sp.]